ncbi:TlpA family protein disulfide reductase [Sphingobacterium corticibacter]|uniref:Thioredoxin domain-containing protein n=1 Tax=Sphingobacterium corticibacter TaxID=2171749 RepID=A0A2T8HKV7_9SPHI|nr:TlpA disulfide reductase family protein [Sphingobacterium corticibacter]PVH26071.1 hypothetical protein DC487_00135 [Sphingobacterium corticibacter]
MMKKIKWIALACSAVLYFQQAQAQEVVAAKEGATYEEILNQINKLASSSKEEDKALLRKEAEALALKKGEDELDLAAIVYERALDDASRANEIRAAIEAAYPQGVTVRNKSYAAMMKEAGEDKSAADIEQLYLAWEKQYPASNYAEKDQNMYHSAVYNLSTRYAKEQNMPKTIELLGQLKGTNYYVPAVATTFDKLPEEQKDYKAFSPLLKDAYVVSKAANESEDPAIKESNSAYYYGAVAPLYAAALVGEKNFDEAILITQSALEEENYGGYYALQNAKTLGNAYAQKGDKAKALETYEKFIAANGKDSTIVAQAQVLYKDVNGDKADFQAHLADLDKQMTEAYFAKYEQEMKKEEAPAFTLMNREGKEVSLASLKGKVVVLDFWATWCGPCIISFPGMQAAVNKYANDDEVEFLFIDTWQREENYKELVDEFIAKNNYNFNVLFDEMKDRSKATVTAYGIQGIPAKVIIDKEGFIRFQNSGSEPNVDKLVKELDTKIALAKRG